MAGRQGRWGAGGRGSWWKRLCSSAPLLLCVVVAGGCAGAKKEPQAGSDQELLQNAETELKGKKYEDARQSLQRLINQYPDSELVAEARLRSAKALFDQERYEEARAEYQRFLELFPEHERIDEARYYIGLSHFRQLEGVDRDQSSAQHALSQFQTLLKTMPDSTYAEDAAVKVAICRHRLAEKEMYVGGFYFQRAQYGAAVNRFNTVLKDYAGIGLDDGALYYKGEALWRLEQREASAQTFQRIVREFPESPFAPQAASRLGVVLVKPVRPKVEDTRPWSERVKSWWSEVVRSLVDTPILQDTSPAK